MNIHVVESRHWDGAVDALIVPVYADQPEKSEAFYKTDQALKGALSHLIAQEGFKGKPGEYVIWPTLGLLTATYVVMIGMGDQAQYSHEILRKNAGTVARGLSKYQIQRAGWFFDVDSTTVEMARALTEGFVMGTYQLQGYRQNQPKQQLLNTLTVISEGAVPDAFTLALQEGVVVGQAVNCARDFANTPANTLTPSEFLRQIQALLASHKNLSIEVIDQVKAKALGMTLFLGVGQGSVEPSYMVVMRYQPVANQPSIALVGKGVTFDSGGISIKPALKMSEMKGDMSGAAAVVATMNAIATLHVPTNVVAVVALTENMASGSAQRPGDVLKAVNGKTVEIINTDAEGRLILADALAYVAAQPNIKEVVDIATLTGACSIALGDCAAAVLGNNQPFIDRLLAISNRTGERLWQLPLYDEHLDYLKSEIADIANASETRLAGTCTGAKFLEQFVGSLHWAHLDVASMMHNAKTDGYSVKGMSGVGVRNLIQYVISSQHS